MAYFFFTLYHLLTVEVSQKRSCCCIFIIHLSEMKAIDLVCAKIKENLKKYARRKYHRHKLMASALNILKMLCKVTTVSKYYNS